MCDNYEQKLWNKIISDALLSGDIMTGNYELVYYVAENVAIIGILAYPKMSSYLMYL